MHHGVLLILFTLKGMKKNIPTFLLIYYLLNVACQTSRDFLLSILATLKIFFLFLLQFFIFLFIIFAVLLSAGIWAIVAKETVSIQFISVQFSVVKEK